MKSFDVVAETRRRWTAEERRRIVAESETAPVSVVARRHAVTISAAQLGYLLEDIDSRAPARTQRPELAG